MISPNINPNEQTFTPLNKKTIKNSRAVGNRKTRKNKAVTPNLNIKPDREQSDANQIPQLNIDKSQSDSEIETSTKIQPVPDDLEAVFVNKQTPEAKDFNSKLLQKEETERDTIAQIEVATAKGDPLTPGEQAIQYLYPSLNDPNFNTKIASKKEFNDTKYEGLKKDANNQVVSIEEYAEELNNAPFELQPHQTFVKNFLSFQTPYNSLLLYHGLGSGKTCSAIGVCEEQRDYLKQMGINKKIIIVAEPNVQDNFRLQLFDSRKLKNIDGLWNINACTGNKLLKEINPTNIKTLSKEAVIKYVNNLINTYYLFVGYIQLSNLIEEVSNMKSKSTSNLDEETKQKNINKLLKQEFSNSLIVIDEVHNIRIASDNAKKTTAINLMTLVNAADNLRFLLLSATPMYNSYTEIIWLINLMNINDKRAAVKVSDIFDTNGTFLTETTVVNGEEVVDNIGEKLFIQKCTGYVSFVRGENPYTFPFRIYPSIFSRSDTFENPKNTYPTRQMNGIEIKLISPSIIPLYLTRIGEYQMYGYKSIIEYLRNKYIRNDDLTNASKMPSFENMESFGYTILQKPLEALNIVYPVEGLKEYAESIQPIEYQSDLISHALAKKDITLFESPNNQLVESEVIAEETIKQNQSNVSQNSLAINKKEENSDNEQSDNDESDNDEEDSSSSSDSSSSTGSSSTGSSSTGSSSEVSTNSSDKTSSGSSSDNSSSSKGGAKKISPSKKVRENTTELINPMLSKITGKKGLKNIMNFEDNINTLTKGNFEYKPNILANEEHGRIFAQKNISKYSSKISNICNSICSLPSEEHPQGKLCDGIVLIYSQYIDGGLVPVALALEEMGFTRFGKGAKSLFASPPPNTNKQLKSLKYVMITGDKRLSKNNDDDVRELTSDLNTNNETTGSVIKVVLISKAGSEGLDFKAIRQIHILDPWYNMSRIEQIIGRGVRNFSHKSIEFKKRNVEIFLYGTLLSDQEEAADLYVYRVAEKKAKQIGIVSRVLKKTAVDCIINHAQTELTNDDFKNQEVEQILSNHKTIMYEVGDVPYSSTCDYMDTCKYICEPSKVNKINEDTYNEKFILVNSDKIIQKIKELMKQRVFYTKKNLIEKIKTPKTFPDVQIFAALSQLIYDKNEYIIDPYGRSGYLVNIGDYYLFQPSELDFNKSSLSAFNRSAPIDYKFPKIQLNIGDKDKDNEINNAIHDTSNLYNFKNALDINMDEINEVDELGDLDELDKENTVMSTIKMNYNSAILARDEYAKIASDHPTDEDINNFKTLNKLQKTKKDLTKEDTMLLKNITLKMNTYKKNLKKIITPDTWYNSCGIVMYKLVNLNLILPDKDGKEESVEVLLQNYLIEHIVDMLLYPDKLNVLNYLTGLTREKDNIEQKVYDYLTFNIIKQGRNVYLVFYDGKTQITKNYDDASRRVLILKKKTWQQVDEVGNKDFNAEIEKIQNEFKKHNVRDEVNNIIGFIGFDKKINHMLFKIKDIHSDRNIAGARCDQESKAFMLKMLNKLVEKKIFTNITTKLYSKYELCIIEEFLLRHYNAIKFKNKIWFFSPEFTELYNLEHCKVKQNKFNY
jgi:hypothetical protein